MRNLFLHFGMHKTGSTSIQHYLFDNRAALLKHGWYYPCEGSYYFHGERSQSYLAHAVLDRRPDYLRHELVLNRDKCIAELQRDVSASNCENILISSEHFSYATTEDEWRKIHDAFSPLADTLKIVIYLRRQDTMAEAYWGQYVMLGRETRRFEDFRSRTGGRDYLSLLRSMANVFGQPNIIVRPFERQQLHQGDVVADFLEQIGLGRFPLAVQSAVLNQSLSLPQLEAMRLILGRIEPLRLRMAMAEFLRSLKLSEDRTSYSYFAPGDRSRFLEPFRESNAQVARVFLGRADGRLFDEPEEPGAPAYPGLSVDDLARSSAVALASLFIHNSKLAEQLARHGHYGVRAS
jgi:hypothetical protein